jgi:hypothetical protein
MPKVQMDYSQTIIYKLCCKNPLITKIYIGHTTNFINRKNNHKNTCNNQNQKNYNLYVYKFIRDNGGWENWSIIQIEEYNCSNKREAESRERHWIELLNAELNSVNPITSYEEKQKQKQDWYEENKEEILEKSKKIYEENKEQKLEYQKEYAQENKETICEYQKEYREKNKEKLAEQKKIYRAEHKEEAAKAHKEWREANKEKISEQKKQIINCECGNQYTFGNKSCHFKSKLHVKYQNQLCGIIEEPKIITEEEEKLKNLRQKQKEYREKNADKIKEFKKKYNEEKKEKIKEQTKKYKEEHKEEIKEKNKQYSKENEEKIKEYKDEWYQKNKEKILQKHKELFVCECGSEIRSSGKAEHNRSSKHQQYINSLNINNVSNDF